MEEIQTKGNLKAFKAVCLKARQAVKERSLTRVSGRFCLNCIAQWLRYSKNGAIGTERKCHRTEHLQSWAAFRGQRPPPCQTTNFVRVFRSWQHHSFLPGECQKSKIISLTVITSGSLAWNGFDSSSQSTKGRARHQRRPRCCSCCVMCRLYGQSLFHWVTHFIIRVNLNFKKINRWDKTPLWLDLTCVWSDGKPLGRLENQLPTDLEISASQTTWWGCLGTRSCVAIGVDFAVTAKWLIPSPNEADKFK